MVGGCMVYGGWVYGGWITTVVIIRPSQPSLAGVEAGAERGKKNGENIRTEKVAPNVVANPCLNSDRLQCR